MIKNTDLLYKKLKGFHDERKGIMDKYERTVNSLERYKGSRAYPEEIKKAEQDRDEALSELRDKYRPGLGVVINGMREIVGKRSVKAPTNEQINILNMLKLKKNPSEEELDRVAQSVSDNPMALGIVTEIARDAGYMMKHYESLCPEISSQSALDGVDSLTRSVNDFLMYDTTRSSRVAARYNLEHNGTSGTLRKIEFETKEDCFRNVCGFNEDYLGKFSELVDGGAVDGGQEVS